MKKVLFVLFLISASVSFSQTDVSGAISSDTTWGTSGSPYTVTGNVLVASGVTLTIEAGVTVKFNSGLYIKIKGTIIAEGTSSSLITFTSSNSSPNKGDWKYIMFDNSNTVFDSEYNYQSGNKMKYCVISYAEYGLRIFQSSFYLDNSTISNNSMSGIDFDDVTKSLISNNTISNNPSGTSLTGLTNDEGDDNHSNDTYKDVMWLANTIKDNDNSGLVFNRHGTRSYNNTYKNNIITGNGISEFGGGYGLDLPWGDTSNGVKNNLIEGNIIYNNGNGIRIGTGPSGWGGSGYDSKVSTIKKNLIINNKGYSINTYETYTNETLVIENNIIVSQSKLK